MFDIISKLGEGSYGSVYKAVHKESKQVRPYLSKHASNGVTHHLWYLGVGHQAGASGHGPPGHHQGDLHHAAVCQSLCGQVSQSGESVEVT